MKHELTILAPESNGDKELDEIQKTIKKYAKIVKFENDGVKRLAYPIRDHERAGYLYYILDMEQQDCIKLSCELNIKDEVLRYLLVRVQ